MVYLFNTTFLKPKTSNYFLHQFFTTIFYTSLVQIVLHIELMTHYAQKYFDKQTFSVKTHLVGSRTNTFDEKKLAEKKSLTKKKFA